MNLVFVACAGLVVGVTGCWLWLRSRPVARRQRSQVLVTLKTGAAFRGLLAASDRQLLVIRDPELVEGDDNRVSVDGEVILPWVDVRYVQRF